MQNIFLTLKKMTVVPENPEEFNVWLKQKDTLEFLKGNIEDDKFVLYASFSSIFIHSFFVPSELVNPPDIEDLMAWNCNASYSWGISQSFSESEEDKFSIEEPPNSTGSKTLDKGEQIIFARYFEGRLGNKNYFELLQKFTHSFGLHFISERNAYCRIDAQGDLEDVITIMEEEEGKVIICKRDLVDQYMVLTKSIIVRTFDFTRWRPNSFNGWSQQEPTQEREENLFYKEVFVPGNASYIRGIQIIYPLRSTVEILKRLDAGSENEEHQYATFLAHDWKHDIVEELSCAPENLGNYFVKSDLPFGTSPAFFRPEVLLKYKADSEKYTLKQRSISCRGAWGLKSYDINEAGQVHTYLIYLSYLPYQEQLYWKSFNEAPKASISRRAFKSDFEASWEFDYDPLTSLLEVIQEIEDQNAPWWLGRPKDLANHLHYPVTASVDEWSEEILKLDKFLIEGFNPTWLRKKAISLGQTLSPEWGSIKVLLVCLIGLGFEEDASKEIIKPFEEVHSLRTKLKGHTSGREVQEIKKRILSMHSSYKKHFRDLVEKCDKSLRKVVEILK